MIHRWSSVLFVTLALVVSGVAMGEEKPMPKRVVLEGVDQYRVVEPVAEGVRVVLNYRGETYSPAYVAGISGAAFRVAGPCPCAPTCWGTMDPVQLARLFGYEAEQIDIGAPYDLKAEPVEASAAARKGRMQAALVRVKDEIRAKRPAILVQAFTAWEWDVVCGFDEEKHELYGRGSYDAMRTEAYTHADEMHALGATEIGGGPYAVLIGEKTGSFDATAAELAALRGAVEHARTAGGKLPVGIECYDQWTAGYQRPGSDPAVKGLPPDWYPLSILPSTRQAAAQFMGELAAKYPEATPYLELASEHFAKEAAALEAARAVLGDRKSKPTEEQCARVAGHLGEARAMYSLGIDEIAAALRKIGGPQSNAGI